MQSENKQARRSNNMLLSKGLVHTVGSMSWCVDLKSWAPTMDDILGTLRVTEIE